MSEHPGYDRSQQVKDQLTGAVVDTMNAAHQHAEQIRQAAQDGAFGKAVEEIDHIREFICSGQALGSQTTKHGEIAEHVEVGIRRAREVLMGKPITATFDGVGRTASVDYMIGGIAVQSKFVNGTVNNLAAVLDHMKDYSDFGRDGSYYHIPRDTHAIIERVMGGDNGGFSERTANSIREKVQLVQEMSGKPFDVVVQPGISSYPEVQIGKVTSTLDNHQHDIANQHHRLKDKIAQEHQPSLGEAAKVVGGAAAVAGALSLTMAIYAKYKSGKNPFRGGFTTDDWKDVGLDTAKGAALGGSSAAALYWMTNYASMAAPFAAAVVSASKGVGELVIRLHRDDITFEEFFDLGSIVCAESAIVGLAAVAGQCVIPVPVLGALLGSIAGRMLAQFATGEASEVAKRLRKDMDRFLAMLDEKLRGVIEAIDAAFDRLGELTLAAFDLTRNLQLLELSIDLARAYGVPDAKLITSHSKLDDFMTA